MLGKFLVVSFSGCVDCMFVSPCHCPVYFFAGRDRRYILTGGKRKMLTSSQLLDATTFSVLASAVDESKFLGIDVSCEHVFSNMALHNFTGTVNLRGERDAGIKVSSEAPFELGKAGLYVEHLNIQADTGAINVTGISTSSLKVTVPKLPFQITRLGPFEYND